MSEARQEPIAATRPIIRISPPVYARLALMKVERQKELSRQVSFTEVIEQLLDRADAA